MCGSILNACFADFVRKTSLFTLHPTPLMHQTFDAALGINLLHANQEGADHNRAHFDACDE